MRLIKTDASISKPAIIHRANLNVSVETLNAYLKSQGIQDYREPSRSLAERNLTTHTSSNNTNSDEDQSKHR